MKHRNLYLSIVSISTALLALTICVLPLAAAAKPQNKQSPDKEACPPSNHTTTNNNATISPATPQGGDEAAEKPRNGIAPTVKPVDTEPIKEETAPDK